MKKTLMRSLSVIMVVLMLAGAVPFASFAADHIHEYGEWTTTKEVTCTEDGSRTRKCKLCSTYETEPILKTGHNYEKVEVKATCAKEGYTAEQCTKCDAIKSGTKVTIPKTAHQWTSKVDAACLKSEACCIASAVYFKSCKVCGEKSEETFTSGSRNPEKHNNVVSLGTDIPATCSSKGYESGKKCTDCDKVVVEAKELDMLPHTPGDKAATCTSGPICAVCESEYGTKNPENHTNIVTDAAVAATCTATGLAEGKHCEACHTVIVAQKELPANGHDFGEWKYPSDYNCEVGGTIFRECNNCEFAETKKADAGHKVVDDAEVAPTCTTEGKTAGKHCDICKTVIEAQKTKPALGHNYKGEVIRNNNQTHSIKCVRCGEIGAAESCFDDNSDCKCDACGSEMTHIFRTYVSNGDATCSADGTKTATCDRCGKAKDTVPDVGSKNPNVHDYKFVKTTDATCLENAKEKGTCSLCGATTIREIPDSKLGHAESDWIYEPNYDCTVGGVRRRKDCTRCNAAYIVFEEEDPKTHSEQVDPAVPVTCTSDGKTDGLHCTFCSKVIMEQITIPATGHEADESGYIILKDADCTNDGLKQATCKNCHQKFEEPILSTGHKYAVTAVAATCTKDGYKIHRCVVCNDEYTDSIVKKTDHKFIDSVYPAKYQKKGSIVSTCTVCGASATTKIYRIEKLTLSQTTFVRDGKAHKPTVTVTDYKGKVLKKGTDYTVKYDSGRKAIGTYKVTVTFKGNYAGTRTLKFKIVPAKVKDVKVTAGKASAKVSWSKVKYATTYEVYAATAKNGKYKKLGATDKLTLNATKLEKGKTYYFKVKAGRKTNGGIVYGDFSAVRKAKIK